MLLTVIFLPLIFATFLSFTRAGTGAVFSPWTTLPAFLFACFGLTEQINFPGLLLETRLGMDDTGQIFLGFTSLIWMIAGFYAVAYFREDPFKKRFFLFFLLTLTGNLGLILALDVVSFYFFFALMSFSAYGMVAHYRTDQAIFAGKIYISLVLIGEVLIFTGLILAVNVAGTHYFTDLPLLIDQSSSRHIILTFLLVGFGIKAGVFPLHVWLPLAHTAAPIPASAVLSGCMVKAGLLGWLRILPLGAASSEGWGSLLVFAGVLTAFYSVFVGLTQNKPKTMLAYSTISHIGVMTVGVGAALTYPKLWPDFWGVLMLYIASHAFIKSALFLSVGTNEMRISSTSLRFLRAVLITLPVLAMIGFPLTLGAASKQLMKHPILAEFYGGGLKSLLIVASFAATLLMLRFLYFIWPRKQNQNVPLNRGVFISWSVLVVLIFFAPLVLSATFPIAWGSLLSIGSAAVLTFLFFYFNIQKPFTIPSGDILSIYLYILETAKRAALRIADQVERRYTHTRNSLLKILRRFWDSEWKVMHLIEKTSESWSFFGAAFLLLLITFLFLTSF